MPPFESRLSLKRYACFHQSIAYGFSKEALAGYGTTAILEASLVPQLDALLFLRVTDDGMGAKRGFPPHPQHFQPQEGPPSPLEIPCARIEAKRERLFAAYEPYAVILRLPCVRETPRHRRHSEP
jgi:hypothetical protein